MRKNIPWRRRLAAPKFEDGSVVYLAERSVVQFKKLQATDDSTESRLYLLTGTATIVHKSHGQDEMFVQTPTSKLHSKDGSRCASRAR